MHTVNTAADDKINVQPHLRPTLLIGKAEESGEINSNYNNIDNVKHLKIAKPLHNWTKRDIWTFASSLYLPYKLAA